MASKSFVLLINNHIARDLDGSIIFEVFERGHRIFKNSKTQEDAEERVEQLIAITLERDSKNPLYEELQSTDIITKYSQEFKLKMINTPLYDLQTQLALNPNVSRLSGSHVNLREIWEEQVADFYAYEFYKYSQIVSILEGIVKRSRPTSSPFTIKSGKHRIMSVVYLKINGLFNPLDGIAGLESTKLFREAYTGKGFEIESLDDPAVFKLDIIQRAIPCYFATSTDVMALCGVKHKEEISSASLYRLIAGICMKNSFAAYLNKINVNSILSFPINKIYYEVYNEDEGEAVEYFNDYASANRHAEQNGFIVNEIDTDAIFVSTAFPSFKKKAITANTELLQKVRSADFVYYY